MKRFIGAFVISGFALTAAAASAQQAGASAGRVEVNAFPGGGTLFTESSSGSDFTNCALKELLPYSFNRFAGLEGKGGGMFGINQKLDLQGGLQSAKPPDAPAPGGSAIVGPAGNNRAFVPCPTGGIGGLTPFDLGQLLGVNDTTTFATGNVGGMTYHLIDRWSVRGDNPFFAVRGKDDAPSFFGQEAWSGQRIYGGIVLSGPK